MNTPNKHVQTGLRQTWLLYHHKNVNKVGIAARVLSLLTRRNILSIDNPSKIAPASPYNIGHHTEISTFHPSNKSKTKELCTLLIQESFSSMMKRKKS